MLSCVECGVGCISLLDLEHHIKAQHVQWEAFECVVCKVKCSSQLEALRHARTHQEGEGEQTMAPVVGFHYTPDSAKSARVWEMLTQAKIAQHQQNPSHNNTVRRTFPNKTRKRSSSAVKKDINSVRRNLWPDGGRSVTPKARKVPKVQQLEKTEQTPGKRGRRKITENTVLHQCALCDSLVSVKQYHVVKMHFDGKLISCSSCGYTSPQTVNVKTHIGRRCPSGHVIDNREQFGPLLRELMKKCFPDTITQVDVPTVPAENELVRASPKRAAKEEAKEKLSQKAKVPTSVRIKGQQGPKSPKVKAPKPAKAKGQGPKISKVKAPRVQKSLNGQGPKTQKVRVPVPKAQLRPRTAVRKMPKRLSRVNGQIKKDSKLVTKRRPKTEINKKLAKSERLLILACALCGTGRIRSRDKRCHVISKHLEGGALMCSDCGYHSPSPKNIRRHIAKMCTNAHVIDRRKQMQCTIDHIVAQCFPGCETKKVKQTDGKAKSRK